MTGLNSYYVAIDNHRVLHGRSSFTGKRRMCGAYIGVDEFRSRLAVLSERFSSSESPVSDSDATTGSRKRTVWSHDF
jgi:trimethyllysine dioxygenase